MAEINLKDIFMYLKKGLVFILAMGILLGAAFFIYSKYWITPMYSSSVKFYASGEKSDLSDLNYSLSVTPQYIEFLNVPEYFDMVSKQLQEENGIYLSAGEISRMISFSSVIQKTSSFYMNVRSQDPSLAYHVARALAKTAPERVNSFENAGALEVVSNPQLSSAPISPSISKNTLLGVFLGLILAAGIVILREVLDNRIRGAEEITELFGLPVFGVVPDFGTGGGKGGKK